MTAAVGVARAASGAAKGAATAGAKGATKGGSAAARGARGRGALSAAEQERREAARAFEADSRRPARTAADRQREGIQAIKDARPAEPAEPDEEEPARSRSGPPAALTDSRGAPSWWGAPDGLRAANTGGGFILGIGAWVLVRTYLDSGGDGVKRLLKAKFFNEVS